MQICPNGGEQRAMWVQQPHLGCQIGPHTEGARPDERYGAALSRAAQPRHQEVAADHQGGEHQGGMSSSM
jgi:hypothetical protein